MGNIVQRKIQLFMILLILILASVVPTSLGVPANNSDTIDQQIKILNNGNILYVGGSGQGNYSSIQSAINDAADGDTIYIFNDSSPYFESLSVEKHILLIGENRDSTVIDGCNSKDDGIIIKAENVKIESLTVKDFRSNERYTPWAQAGMKIYYPNVTVNNCKLISNRMGIEVYTGAHNTTITNNELINDGIMLGNYFVSSEYPDITIIEFLHNIDNNIVNGKPLYYLVDVKDFVMPSDAGQIILVNCTNITVKNLQMSNNDFSLILAYCNYCLLENLTIFDTDGEVLFFECHYNIIQNNTIYNTFKAICLEYKSSYNTVRYNNVSNNYAGLSIFTDANNNIIYKNIAYNNEMAGLEIITAHGGTQRDNRISKNEFFNNKIGIHLIHNSKNNIIERNNIRNNKFGILLQDKSCYNKITRNNIQKNTIPAVFIKCEANTWHRNYWNRPRILRKPIFGLGLYGVPRVDFDKGPALKPFEI
jgi:parallel beta-helix repeat protein